MSPHTVMLPIAALLGGLFGGCATQGNPPSEELTRARTVVEQADRAGGSTVCLGGSAACPRPAQQR